MVPVAPVITGVTFIFIIIIIIIITIIIIIIVIVIRDSCIFNCSSVFINDLLLLQQTA
jgi:hypothetical protein